MWKTVSLGEYITVQNGYAFNSKLFDADGEIGLIRIRDLKEGVSTETRYTGDYDRKFIVQRGDLLIGMDGEFRCYEWKGENALLNQRVCRLQDFDNELDKRFLLYAINDELKKIEDVTGFTTVKHLSSKAIKEIQLHLPPLAEQQRIVAKLDAAFAEIDETIHATKIKIQNYFKLEETNKRGFFSNLSSSLIELEKTGEIINGYAFKSGDFQHSNGVPVIKITNVGIRDFVETNDVNLPKDFLAKHKQFAVKQGDIVFALTRTVINGGLKVAVVPKGYEGALLNQRVASVSANPKLMNSEFLYSYLSSSMVLDYVLANVNTLMQPNLSITDLKKLPVPNIPVDKQVAYSQTLKETEIQFQNIRTIETKKLSELEKLKSSILAQELQSEAA